jgi:2-hydroxychromene-2-carboxylate isomerase
MQKIVDYYYTPVSPFAYLGAARFRAICAEHGATVVHKPIDLGRIFPLSGGLPVAKRPQQRQAYRLVELKRWSDFLGMPMNVEPAHFPVPADTASWMILAAIKAGHDPFPLSEAIMRAVWVEDRDVSDLGTLIAIADTLGLPGQKLLAEAAEDDVVGRFIRYTDEAIALGVFGAPTYSYRGEMFWGQDRLDFLSRALSEK